MSSKLSFVNNDQSDFYPVLKKRVNDYFQQKGITHYANGFMVFKIIFFLSGFVASYLMLIFGELSLPLSYVSWFSLGLFTAFVGANVCHDAAHGAISQNKTVNTVLAYLFNVVGANAYLWGITHNIQHHTFTNIEGYDGDIESVPLVRLSPHKKLLAVNRFQHIYTFIFYGFTSLLWVFYKDYRSISKNKFGNYINKKHSVGQFFILFFFKAIYYSLFLAVPIIVLDFPIWHILLGFVLMHFVEGICLAIIIQLAHMVENVEFPLPDKDGNMPDSWAVHQLRTTANYARNSWLVTFFFGGLNFHIEHHLFQRICHVHHKPLSKIVKSTAEEFNVPYQEFPSLGSALLSHVKFLKNNGRKQ